MYHALRPVHPTYLKRRVNRRPRQTLQHRALGIHKLSDQSYGLFHKFFWLCVVASCFAIFLYHLINRVTVYLSHPMRLELKVKEQSEIQFPPLVLCSAALISFLHWGAHRNGSSKVSFDELYYTLTVDPTAVTVKRECYQLTGDEKNCDYQPVEGNMKVGFENTIFGRCIQLELKKKANYLGPFTKLSVRWNLSEKEQRYFGPGLKYYYFYLVKPSLPPNHSVLLLSEIALIGKDHLVRVSKKKFQFENTPNNPCVERPALWCIKRCIEELVESKVPCRLPFMTTSNHASCKNYNQTITTFRIAVEQYFNQKLDKCNCSRSCTDIVHKLYVDDSSELANNTGGITLLYTDDTEETMNEVAAYSRSELFSDIGGALGLYLGISFLTVFDMLDWALHSMLTGDFRRHFFFS